MGRRLITWALAGASLACSSASGPLDLGPAPMGVLVYSRMQYYDVSAATLGALRTQMRERGPRTGGQQFTAVTNWNIRWRYELDARGSSCELRKAHVRVEATVTYPRWTPQGVPDPALLAWWNQMDAGLKEHERGHAQIAVNGAGAIARAVQGMTGGRCDALSERANEVAERHSSMMGERQVAYDLETRHGDTQIQEAGRRTPQGSSEE